MNCTDLKNFDRFPVLSTRCALFGHKRASQKHMQNIGHVRANLAQIPIDGEHDKALPSAPRN